MFIFNKKRHNQAIEIPFTVFLRWCFEIGLSSSNALGWDQYKCIKIITVLVAINLHNQYMTGQETLIFLAEKQWYEIDAKKGFFRLYSFHLVYISAETHRFEGFYRTIFSWGGKLCL